MDQLLKLLEQNAKLTNDQLSALLGKSEEEIAKAQALSDNVWLSPNFERNNKETIQLALDAGIGVSFWTVNTLEDAKMLYDMGVRYIESDILCK